MVRSDDGKDNRGPSCPYFVSGMEIVCPGLVALARLEERMPWIVMSASEARLLGNLFQRGFVSVQPLDGARLIAVAGSGGRWWTK